MTNDKGQMISASPRRNDLGEAENNTRAMRADTLNLCEVEPVTSVSEYPAAQLPSTVGTRHHRYLVFVFFTISSICFSQGSLEHISKFESRFVEARDIDVWLPNDYSVEKKYAVMYMHDGQMLFDAKNTWNHQSWEADSTMQEMINANKIEPTIIVGIHNSGALRRPEYFPQKAFNLLPSSTQDSLKNIEWKSGPLADNYLNFIVTELKPYIDSHYSTFTDQGHTSIAGSSMGALISMYACCEYPQVFGKAICMSMHWPGSLLIKTDIIPFALLDYFEQNLPAPGTVHFYFDHGTHGLDARYGPYQKQANKILKKKGYKKRHFTSRVFKNTDHSESAWRKRFLDQ
jgi:predicted alpha/beta superfamily hydrolase